MALNDILLHIDSYPDVTPDSAIDRAVQFTATVGGKLAGLAVQVQFPLKSNRVADYMIGLSRLSHEEEARSRQSCMAGLAHFTAQAKAAGVFQDALLEKTNLYGVSDHVATRARTRDLCIVPLAGRFDGQQELAQTVAFGSGRPVLVLDADSPDTGRAELGVVVLAWDGSRCAARAMADALPVLVQARAVRVLTIINDKPDAVADMGADAVRHLKAHGAAAVADEVDRAGRSIGDVLDAYLSEHDADLLVMGAYGHSRLREFILGGATEHMLKSPPVPVFMSH